MKCGSCTYCCKDVLIPVTDAEALSLKTQPRAGLSVLQQKENGDCIYLKNGCTIYGIRPEVCRVYNCIGFYELAKKKNLGGILNDKHFMNAVTRAIKRNT